MNNLGKLFYLPTGTCGICKQHGHDSRTCRGKGFVRATVDECLAAVYAQMEERARTSAGVAAAAGEDHEPPVLDHTQDEVSEEHTNTEDTDTEAEDDEREGNDEVVEEVLEQREPEVVLEEENTEEHEDDDEDQDQDCDYRSFYESLGGSDRMRSGFDYATECQGRAHAVVECASCNASHHRHCFLKADCWNQMDTITHRRLPQGSSICWSCYSDERMDGSE